MSGRGSEFPCFGNPSSCIHEEAGMQYRDWTRALAFALVNKSKLPTTAVEGIRQVFIDFGVVELRILLANGSSGTRLEVYEIISNGNCVMDAMKPDGADELKRNAAEVCLNKREVLINKGRYADEDETGDLGTRSQDTDFRWTITSPLECTMATCNQLLGVSQIVSIATVPSINPEWLYDWSCEVADSVAHASVMVMEDALDTLHSVFPYYLVDWLITNVANTHISDQKEISKIDDTAPSFSLDAGTSNFVKAPPTSVGALKTKRGGVCSSGYPSCKVYSPTSPSSTLSPDIWRSRSVVNQEDQTMAAFDPIQSNQEAMSSSKGESWQFPAARSSTDGSSVSIVSEWQWHQQKGLMKRTSSIEHEAELSENEDQMSQEYFGDVVGGATEVDVFEPEIIGFEDLVLDDVRLAASRRASQCLDRAHFESMEMAPLSS